jgi:hypothetical protein
MKNKMQVLRSLFVLLAFIFALYGRALFTHLFDRIEFDSYLWKLIFTYSWWLVPVIAASGLMFGFRQVPAVLGLSKGLADGTLFAVLAVLPMFVGSAIIGDLNPGLNIADLIHKTLVAGFMEELLFRGFLFGILFYGLGWGFIPASLTGALFFGLGHIYQGTGFMEIAGIFMLTFSGALWFSWLYAEWYKNLWLPAMLHILMNMSWALFEMGNNAVGDLSSNIFRVMTIALTIIVTVVYCRRRGEFMISRKNLFRSHKREFARN